MNLQELNDQSAELSHGTMRQCCGARRWIAEVAKRRPFETIEMFHREADSVFDQLSDDDWIEAFSCHPKIGDVDSLRMKFAGNSRWSASEQFGLSVADETTIDALAKANVTYQERFGYIFIVCASGKSAREMLELLKHRLRNDAETELPIAAAEQRKITHLRIDKLFQPID